MELHAIAPLAACFCLAIAPLAIAEDPVHAFNRLMEAGQAAIHEMDGAPTPELKIQYEIEALSDYAAGCDEIERTPVSIYPAVVQLCRLTRARIARTPEPYYTEIKIREAQLRQSALSQ